MQGLGIASKDFRAACKESDLEARRRVVWKEGEFSNWQNNWSKERFIDLITHSRHGNWQTVRVITDCSRWGKNIYEATLQMIREIFWHCSGLFASDLQIVWFLRAYLTSKSQVCLTRIYGRPCKSNQDHRYPSCWSLLQSASEEGSSLFSIRPLLTQSSDIKESGLNPLSTTLIMASTRRNPILVWYAYYMSSILIGCSRINRWALSSIRCREIEIRTFVRYAIIWAVLMCCSRFKSTCSLYCMRYQDEIQCSVRYSLLSEAEYRYRRLRLNPLLTILMWTGWTEIRPFLIRYYLRRYPMSLIRLNPLIHYLECVLMKIEIRTSVLTSYYWDDIRCGCSRLNPLAHILNAAPWKSKSDLCSTRPIIRGVSNVVESGWIRLFIYWAWRHQERNPNPCLIRPIM